ncbi:MAG: pyridoxal-phosphate dependent enzyme [Candidatus Hydrogenedentes bacterium]|nr:pyridoxal-phosphate dependent enzyme [Candidatus Hydrogenedentota bacterium]
MIPLFEVYPGLEAKLPYLALGEFPTPVTHCEHLGPVLGLDRLYIKRDDISGPVYGGNKVRKLEFLLGKAKAIGAKEVMTFGFAGSNHALCTAIYARQAGLRSISMLLPQVNSKSLQRNLLLGHAFGAELHHYSNRASIALGVMSQSLRHRLRTGKSPMVIPAGGSNPIGIAGFVNAAFELREQVMNGELPEPDIIYVAVGSMGSVVGLLIGLKAAEMKTKVAPIRVIDSSLANPAALGKLAEQTLSMLTQQGSDFPRVTIDPADLELREEYYGERYAEYTPECVEAMNLLYDSEGVRLDGTYSGKAMAAVVGDARKGLLKGKTVVFWDTYNSRPIWNKVPMPDYHALPKTLHRYFESNVQPLDSIG